MNKKTSLILLALLLAAASSVMYMARPAPVEPIPTPNVGPALAAVQPAATEDPTVPETPPQTPPAVTIDTEEALAIRAMGNPSAPVVIEEFASLTCSHCADFYKTVFPKLKEKYIDTGKLYFVYSDFPLNEPALDAAMVARCLPQDQYFPFIEYLFGSLDSWAYDRNYRETLKKRAVLAGMDQATFDACLADQGLRYGIAEKQQTSQKEHEIAATPSFVINDDKTLRGEMSLESFSRIIDPLLEKAGKAE